MNIKKKMGKWLEGAILALFEVHNQNLGWTGANWQQIQEELKNIPKPKHGSPSEEIVKQWSEMSWYDQVVAIYAACYRLRRKKRVSSFRYQGDMYYRLATSQSVKEMEAANEERRVRDRQLAQRHH